MDGICVMGMMDGLQLNWSSLMLEQGGQEITCKKIQNYIFNFSDLLGQGNFSKVYKAHHEITKEAVAIKIIELNSLKSKKLEELLFSEIDILKKLNHPNVLRCHEVFTSNRNCYIITELCNEGDLETRLRNRRALREAEAHTYIADIFRGLLYLADNHIVHRDLKVANIFIHNGQAKLADFGFAKLTKSKFKDINIGSPIYMSPEGLIDNLYGPKTDIWAFGMLIYELLHGETPFSHCKSEHELKYNMAIPIGWNQLRPELSPELKEVIIRCLEVDETKRISAAELKGLPYFARLFSSSPLRRKEYSAQDSQTRSFLGDQTTLPTMRSDTNFYENHKYRIRTENEINQRVARELSDFTRPSLTKDVPTREHPLLKQEKSINTLRLEEERTRRLSKGKYSISSNALVPNSTALSPTLGSSSSKLGASEPRQAILSGGISFKECVNILHYCRLLFKHVVLMRETGIGDENQASIFKKWLSAILKTLTRQISERKVRYEGGNNENQEKKLREVTSEYVKKYTRELGLEMDRVRLEQSLILNYDKICNYFTSVWQMVDQLIQRDSTPSLLQLGHSIILICTHTRILKQCYEQRTYKTLERLKEIEDFLALNKKNLDMPSYLWYKKKAALD